MPSTALGVVLLIVFALPGYTYQRAVEKRASEHVLTVFHELLAILFAGVIVNVITGMVIASAATAMEVPRPDVRALILKPGAYTADHVGLMGFWLLALAAGANCVAYAAGTGLLVRALPQRWAAVLAARTVSSDPQQSAWWRLFQQHRNLIQYVTCTLDDGSYVAGRLYSHSRSATEGPDRDLVLSGDISYRPAGANAAFEELADINAVVVSARHIVLLTISYVEPPQQQSVQPPAMPTSNTTP